MPRLKWLMFQMPMSSPQMMGMFGLLDFAMSNSVGYVDDFDAASLYCCCLAIPSEAARRKAQRPRRAGGRSLPRRAVFAFPHMSFLRLRRNFRSTDIGSSNGTAKLIR